MNAELHVHSARRIEVGEPVKLGEGSYYMNLYISDDNGCTEVTVFSSEPLQIEKRKPLLERLGIE